MQPEPKLDEPTETAVLMARGGRLLAAGQYEDAAINYEKVRRKLGKEELLPPPPGVEEETVTIEARRGLSEARKG
eukprot:SAG31_NODE_29024_length_402_cov_0.627063_1_plen_74_part_10